MSQQRGQALQDPFLLRNSVSQMIYKHAISTVVPSRAVKINLESDEEPEKGPGNE
jgi:sRNA-binding regulator protein Hfq